MLKGPLNPLRLESWNRNILLIIPTDITEISGLNKAYL